MISKSGINERCGSKIQDKLHFRRNLLFESLLFFITYLISLNFLKIHFTFSRIFENSHHRGGFLFNSTSSAACETTDSLSSMKEKLKFISSPAFSAILGCDMSISELIFKILVGDKGG